MKKTEVESLELALKFLTAFVHMNEVGVTTTERLYKVISLIYQSTPSHKCLCWVSNMGCLRRSALAKSYSNSLLLGTPTGYLKRTSTMQGKHNKI